MYHESILKQYKKGSAHEKVKAVHFDTTSSQKVTKAPSYTPPSMRPVRSLKTTAMEDHHHRPPTYSLGKPSELKPDTTWQKTKNEGPSKMDRPMGSSATAYHKQSNRQSDYSLAKSSNLELQKIRNEVPSDMSESVSMRHSSLEDSHKRPSSYFSEKHAKLKPNTETRINPEFQLQNSSSSQPKRTEKSEPPIREKMEIEEPNPKVDHREKDLGKAAEEIADLKTLLDKELMNQLIDLERMAVGHSSSLNLVSEFKKQMEVTLQNMTSQADGLRKKILEEAIPKIGTINKRLAKLLELKQEVELGINEMESMSRKMMSSKADVSLRRNPMDLLRDLESKIKDSQQLNQDVYNKILASKQSFHDNVNKTIEFYSKGIEKARDVLEKTVLKTIKYEEKKAQSVDLCFMIDCTGSMGRYIEMVCKRITRIIVQLQKRFPGFQIRISVLGYRDIEDDARFEILQFCSSIERVQEFLGKIQATGGQDFPEDVNGAFRRSLFLEWGSLTKIIVHIADAPCHGHRFHNLGRNLDAYFSGYKGDADYERIFEEFKKKQINYVFLKIGDDTDKMFKTFKEIYDKTGSKNSDLLFVQDEIQMSSERFCNLVVDYVTQSVLVSVKQTLNTLQSNTPKTIQEREIPCLVEADNEDDNEDNSDNEDDVKKKKKTFRLSDEISCVAPKWDVSSFFDGTGDVKIYYLYKVNKLKHLINNEFTFTKDSAKLQVVQTPFGKGGFHLAYYCKAKPSIARDPYHMVLKRSIKEQNKTYYFSVLKKNTLAINLSEQFNKLLQCAGFSPNEQIYFTRVLAVKHEKKYYLLEAFIEGQFEKYTNNFTYVNESVPLMSAFSHFSYEFTKGKFMVADLQGSNNLLTDPVVHSFNIEFPHQGDLGLKGMLGFFRYHECNHYCKALHLGPHSAQKERVDEIVKTPVKFDMRKPYKKCRFYYCNRNALHDNLCEFCQDGINTL